MIAQERPEAGTRSTMTADDEALRVLANTRRTLLKLVANIDEVLESVSSQERKESGPR